MKHWHLAVALVCLGVQGCSIKPGMTRQEQQTLGKVVDVIGTMLEAQKGEVEVIQTLAQRGHDLEGRVTNLEAEVAACRSEKALKTAGGTGRGP